MSNGGAVYSRADFRDDTTIAELDRLFSKVSMDELKNKTAIERLMTYAWLSREMVLRHIFQDANGRASTLLLYSLILNDDALPMINLSNPNILDANGPEKLCYRLLESMENYLNAGRTMALPESKEQLFVKDLELSDQLKSLQAKAIEFFDDDSHVHWSGYHSE